MILDIRLRAFLLALYFAWLGVLMPHAQSHKITLKGRLFASEEQVADGIFFTDPEGDFESVTLQVTPGGVLSDYLAGSLTHRVVITIEPLDR